jgi:hypothetical protein
MKRWTFSIVCAVAALTASMMPATAKGDDWSDSDDRQKLSVTVSFGAGLNTGLGAPNQHIMPPTIRVAAGGVVNFVVGGFHQIFVYIPGIGPGDIVVPDTGTFINYVTDINGNNLLIYQGLSPVGTPPDSFSNSTNRVESVSFSDPGTYLVICNVRSHFVNSQMYAFVQVGDDEGGDNQGEHRHQH